jgi:hypothetical protein
MAAPIISKNFGVLFRLTFRLFTTFWPPEQANAQHLQGGQNVGGVRRENERSE